MRAAVSSDLSYLVHLSRANSESLGFIPRTGMSSHLDRGHVSIACENGDPAGYLLSGGAYAHAPFVRPIYQACIDYDARRRHLGLQLVTHFEHAALLDRISVVRLWCRESLPSNEFWRAAGYSLCGKREGGKKRKTACNLWAKIIRPIAADDIVSVTHPTRGPAGLFVSPGSQLNIWRPNG